MKHIHFIIALMMALSVSAQETTDNKKLRWLFKMSPQDLVNNTLKVGGEFLNTLNSKSISVFLQGIANNTGGGYWNGHQYNGLVTEIIVRKYLLPIQERLNRKDLPYTHGIYFSGFLKGGAYSGDFKGDDTSWDPVTNIRTSTPYQFSFKAKNIAAGFMIGLQRMFWKTISLDVYMGAGYQASQVSYKGTISSYYSSANYYGKPDYSGVIPKFGVLIGLAM